MRASMAHYGALWTDLEHNKENAKTPLEMPVLALGGSQGEETDGEDNVFTWNVSDPSGLSSVEVQFYKHEALPAGEGSMDHVQTDPKVVEVYLGH